MLATNLIRTHFPYHLEIQDDGRYVITNRGYKPIGFLVHDWVEYANYPIAVRIKGLTPKVAGKLSHEGSPSVDSIYLYDDTTNPERGKPHLDAYLKRLALLMSLKIEQ